MNLVNARGMHPLAASRRYDPGSWTEYAQVTDLSGPGLRSAVRLPASDGAR